MQRRRRRAPGEKKRGDEDFDSISELTDRIEVRLQHRQLKAELELIKLEHKLNQHIRWLQNRRFNQLNEM